MTQDPLYRELILERFNHPQNYGVLKNADIDETLTNPLCGDEIRITAKIKSQKIKAVAFTSSGCAISKAYASLFSEMIKGKTVSAVRKMKPDAVLKGFKVCLTPARLKCALLAYFALQKALAETHSICYDNHGSKL